MYNNTKTINTKELMCCKENRSQTENLHNDLADWQQKQDFIAILTRICLCDTRSNGTASASLTSFSCIQVSIIYYESIKVLN